MQNKTNPGTQSEAKNVKESADHCIEAHRTCTQTIPHCLAQGGLHSEVKIITLLMECAEICELNAKFLMRGSQRHEKSCDLCADICDECARECKNFIDDIFMQRCAEVCEQCSVACRKMAQKP